jgi:hypothetical protein
MGIEAWPMTPREKSEREAQELALRTCYRSFGKNDRTCYKPKGHQGPHAGMRAAARLAALAEAEKGGE